MMMPIEERCFSSGTPFSLQWDYYTHDKLEKGVSLKASIL